MKNKKAEGDATTNYVVIIIVIVIFFLVFYFLANQTNIFKSALGIE